MDTSLLVRVAAGVLAAVVLGLIVVRRKKSA
jgi:LPXTG-motif cell wall-anchored protein